MIMAPFRCLWNSLFRCKVEQNTPEGWNWYYLGRHYNPAEIQLYSPGCNKFKDFQAKVDEWRKDLGLRRGFFYLLNYSPYITAGVVSKVEQLNSAEVKIKNALTETGPPAMGFRLHVINMILHRAMMF